jgi:hypothetical protein
LTNVLSLLSSVCGSRARALQYADRRWTIEATRPAYPSVVVGGSSTFEWLEGEQFVIQRSRADHPDFLDSISVIGPVEERLSMHYYDSRGVHRVYSLEMSDGVLRIARDAPGFSQRFEAKLADGGDTLAGVWQLSRDDATWDDDLEITYRRATTASHPPPDAA